ncbi:hypothetical protein PAMP_006390 [Pampus punctatissimus]
MAMDRNDGENDSEIEEDENCLFIFFFAIFPVSSILLIFRADRQKKAQLSLMMTAAGEGQKAFSFTAAAVESRMNGTGSPKMFKLKAISFSNMLMGSKSAASSASTAGRARAKAEAAKIRAAYAAEKLKLKLESANKDLEVPCRVCVNIINIFSSRAIAAVRRDEEKSDIIPPVAGNTRNSLVIVKMIDRDHVDNDGADYDEADG